MRGCVGDGRDQRACGETKQAWGRSGRGRRPPNPLRGQGGPFCPVGGRSGRGSRRHRSAPPPPSRSRPRVLDPWPPPQPQAGCEPRPDRPTDPQRRRSATQGPCGGGGGRPRGSAGRLVAWAGDSPLAGLLRTELTVSAVRPRGRWPLRPHPNPQPLRSRLGWACACGWEDAAGPCDGAGPGAGRGRAAWAGPSGRGAGPPQLTWGFSVNSTRGAAVLVPFGVLGPSPESHNVRRRVGLGHGG